ncbi:MAG TPA: AMP-binding protein, partial [Gammaproteobacteria bacterium]|nr:AMP-binding protein [Gammaproteobacteria bacterium]
IAIYLGIIKMGGVVVAIPDSFSAEEIATRLTIAHTKAIFTQDFILRETKKLPLYDKVIAAGGPKTIVLPALDILTMSLRQNDMAWQDFLLNDDSFTATIADPHTPTNILFSSGTTGVPKAIPWNHTTGIKAASDAFFHQNIQSDDILAWPTNLGWMMGPWLIFAGLINQATLATYPNSPRDRAFGKFIQDTKVTMLGVVPALVATWRQSHCMEGLDWTCIRRFSSTAECSNAEDMLYLISLAHYKPVIEYCGGTETGGAYISSTMIQPNYPSVFTTEVFGMDFVILNENGELADNGEVALIPPSMGLSFELINADHHEIYYAHMPILSDGRILRRHGDHILRLDDHHYCILGRVDDTMKLGGIKISSAEIERVLVGIENIIETAAIAIPPSTTGPSRLVIYAATSQNLDKENIKKIMQTRINQHLNPLFKIYDIVLVSELPKTASNKIMRRTLRKNYS